MRKTMERRNYPDQISSPIEWVQLTFINSLQADFQMYEWVPFANLRNRMMSSTYLKENLPTIRKSCKLLQKRMEITWANSLVKTRHKFQPPIIINPQSKIESIDKRQDIEIKSLMASVMVWLSLRPSITLPVWTHKIL